MDVYCTSKNSGPSWSRDPVYLLYMGISLEEAREAVEENFRRYIKPQGYAESLRYPYIYSAIPAGMPREVIDFYDADGWWYSIVKINIEPPTDFRETTNQ